MFIHVQAAQEIIVFSFVALSFFERSSASNSPALVTSTRCHIGWQNSSYGERARWYFHLRTDSFGRRHRACSNQSEKEGCRIWFKSTFQIFLPFEHTLYIATFNKNRWEKWVTIHMRAHKKSASLEETV